MPQPLSFRHLIAVFNSGCLALHASTAFAASPPAPLPPGTALFPPPPSPQLTVSSSGNDQKLLELNASKAPSASAGPLYRATVLQAATPFYRAALVSPKNTEPIAQGDTVLIRFSMRTLASSSANGAGRIEAYVQQSVPAWAMASRFNHTAGPEWKTLIHSFRAERDWPAETLDIALHLGQYAQTLEFKDLVWENLGPNMRPEDLPRPTVTYAGREPDAPWRAEAERRILKIPQGRLYSPRDRCRRPARRQRPY